MTSCIADVCFLSFRVLIGSVCVWVVWMSGVSSIVLAGHFDLIFWRSRFLREMKILRKKHING